MFPTKLEQQAHSKRPQGCESRPLDPEDGICSDTIMEVLDRKRETTRLGEAPVKAQWEELWRILFPRDFLVTIPSHGK